MKLEVDVYTSDFTETVIRGYLRGILGPAEILQVGRHVVIHGKSGTVCYVDERICGVKIFGEKGTLKLKWENVKIRFGY